MGLFTTDEPLSAEEKAFIRAIFDGIRGWEHPLVSSPDFRFICAYLDGIAEGQDAAGEEQGMIFDIMDQLEVIRRRLERKARAAAKKQATLDRLA